LLYFKLLPLAVLRLFLFAATEAQQSNGDRCLRCVMHTHACVP